jgi:hypothetical protein
MLLVGLFMIRTLVGFVETVLESSVLIDVNEGDGVGMGVANPPIDAMTPPSPAEEVVVGVWAPKKTLIATVLAPTITELPPLSRLTIVPDRVISEPPAAKVWVPTTICGWESAVAEL